MRLRLTLAFVVIAACNQKVPVPAPASAQPPPAEVATVPRITPPELQKRLGTVTVIDVRAADNYTFAHIPGSMHIPLSFIEQEAPYLPKDKPIVTYCT